MAIALYTFTPLFYLHSFPSYYIAFARGLKEIVENCADTVGHLPGSGVRWFLGVWEFYVTALCRESLD